MLINQIKTYGSIAFGTHFATDRVRRGTILPFPLNVPTDCQLALLPCSYLYIAIWAIWKLLIIHNLISREQQTSNKSKIYTKKHFEFVMFPKTWQLSQPKHETLMLRSQSYPTDDLAVFTQDSITRQCGFDFKRNTTSCFISRLPFMTLLPLLTCQEGPRCRQSKAVCQSK